MNFQRIKFFLSRYLLKHPVYMLTYVFTYFLKDFSFKVHFYSQEEIIKLLKEGRSLIRLGDGDIATIHLGLKNAYHTPNKNIRKMLDTPVKKYDLNSPYILSVPKFINVSNIELHKIGKFNVWLPVKVMFLLRFNKQASYMDAHNFYYDNYFDTIIAPIFKDKKIICITNKKTIDKQSKNKNLPWKDISYIETPEYDALLAYDNIVSNIKKEINKYKPEDLVLFFAMGPVGKYMIYEFSKKGYQGIDIGKVAEVMFTGESIEYMI